MTYDQEQTMIRFEGWAPELHKRFAVPMLVICCGVKAGHPMYGMTFCMDAQGKSPQEMIDLLRSAANDIERQLKMG